MEEGAEGQRFVKSREESPKLDLIVVLRSGNRKDVPDFSERLHSKRTKGNGQKLQEGKSNWTEEKKKSQ